MSEKIERYIFTKNKEGEEVAVDNPEYVKQMHKEKYDFFLKKSGIPVFYWNISFSDYYGQKDSEEFKKIKYYADHCHEERFKYVSLYLWGKQGCQKTALACNIGKRAIEHGLRVKFVLASDLISMLIKTSGYSKDEEIENEVDLLKECDLLILDDIADVSKHLSWNNSKHLINAEWDNFLRHSLSNGLKIIFTSNNNLESTKDLFGESLYELLDRNVESIFLTESVKIKRKLNVKNAFEGM